MPPAGRPGRACAPAPPRAPRPRCRWCSRTRGTTEAEVLRARVNLSSGFDNDLTYRSLETNQPERYAGDPPGAWSVIQW